MGTAPRWNQKRLVNAFGSKKLEAVIVANEDVAGACIEDVAGTRNHDDVLVSRDLADAAHKAKTVEDSR